MTARSAIDNLQAERLAPYARHSLERAAHLALRLHAEELSPEHWLAALLEDESCSATRVVLHAFADPETIGVEVLALCAGIMVVGSGRTLPFSVLGVESLRSARDLAVARGAARVEVADLFRATGTRLTKEAHARLSLLPGACLEPADPPGTPGEAVLPATGPLFRHYSSASLRVLGTSCKVAATFHRSAIGPVHLLLACLELDQGMRERSGLSPSRTRMALSGLDEDQTPLPARCLEGDARLRELLAGLPSGAQTVDVLGWLLAHGTVELTALLLRQKVTPVLLERCRGAYLDPPSGP